MSWSIQHTGRGNGLQEKMHKGDAEDGECSGENMEEEATARWYGHPQQMALLGLGCELGAARKEETRKDTGPGGLMGSWRKWQAGSRTATDWIEFGGSKLVNSKATLEEKSSISK